VLVGAPAREASRAVAVPSRAAEAGDLDDDRAVDDAGMVGGMPRWVPWAVGAAAALTVGYLGWRLLRPGSALRTAIDQPHTAAVVLRNPHRPWLADTARLAHMDALRTQEALFGSMAGHIDDEVDAFRHAFGSGLLELRLMRDRGVSQDTAGRLVSAIGRAHELDGVDNVASLASRMDDLNNAAGLRILGDGRLPGGAWIGEAALRDRVLEALRGGELRVIERAADGVERLVATTGATLPRLG
jgi:hypothetical protein